MSTLEREKKELASQFEVMRQQIEEMSAKRKSTRSTHVSLHDKNKTKRFHLYFRERESRVATHRLTLKSRQRAWKNTSRNPTHAKLRYI